MVHEFRNMPELKWQYSYPICMIVMLIIAIALIIFSKEKWF